MIKVLHTISSLDLSKGGPSLSTWSLVNGLREIASVQVDILTHHSADPEEEAIGEGDFVHYMPPPAYPRFGYSGPLRQFLTGHRYDIYHAHGLWQYATHATLSASKAKSAKSVISPRGMLYPDALLQSKWFKRLAWLLYQKHSLEHACVIHATCEQEKKHIRNLAIKTPIAIIPNAIPTNVTLDANARTSFKKRLGFVGRLAPIKNLEVLFKAWSRTGGLANDWELLLIGDGPLEYKKRLLSLAESLGMENIVFAGFLSGEAKEAAFQSLSYLILPSKSENFGMVVPEALIRQIPVIASKGTPWQELETHEAGWWCETSETAIAEAIAVAIQQDEAHRLLMGSNGQKLVESKYSIEVVAEQMSQLYGWILGEAPTPPFVEF